MDRRFYIFIEFIGMVLAILTLMAALVGIHHLSTNPLQRFEWGFYAKFVAISFPFLLLIKDKTVRTFALTTCTIAMFIHLSAVCLLSMGLTGFVAFKPFRVLIVVAMFILIPIISKQYSATLSNKLSTRMVIYKTMHKTWSHKFLGEGIGAFKALKMKMKARRRKPVPVLRGHSDLIQGFYELGVLRMILLCLIVFLPIFFIRADIWSVSYMNVLAQILTDFPIQRVSTCILSVIIIAIMYIKRLGDKSYEIHSDFNN